MGSTPLRFDAAEDRRKQGGRGLAAGLEGMVRRPEAELREDRDGPAQQNDLRARAEDRDDPRGPQASGGSGGGIRSVMT
jgi:hypothetical protein